MTPIPLPDQIACVRREIAMRDGTLRQTTRPSADREIATMRAVLDTLLDLQRRQDDGR